MIPVRLASVLRNRSVIEHRRLGPRVHKIGHGQTGVKRVTVFFAEVRIRWINLSTDRADTPTDGRHELGAGRCWIAEVSLTCSVCQDGRLV